MQFNYNKFIGPNRKTNPLFSNKNILVILENRKRILPKKTKEKSVANQFNDLSLTTDI